MSTLDTSAFSTVVGSAHHISILLSGKPAFDQVSAALGLKIGLENSGKTTRIVCPDPAIVEFNRLVGVDTIVDTFGSRDLVITFPDQTEHVDKVSYNLNKGELQLVISPKADSPELDYRKLKFIAGVTRTDLIIMIGVSRISDLGPLSDQAKTLMSSTTSISIFNRLPKEKFATHEIHDTEAASLSEMIAHISNSADLKLDQDAASNLLAGMEKATDNFQSPAVTVGTFEAAAILMRKGAKRHFEISASQFPPGSIPTNTIPVPDQITSVAKASPPAQSSQIGYGTDSSDSSPTPVKSQKAPADWYEPKVFKGPTLP